MPTYSIQGPDGKTYSIDGPAGATREQVIAKIQSQLGSGASSAEPSTFGDIAKSFGRGLTKGVMGIAGIPGDLESATRSALDYVLPLPGGQHEHGGIPAPPTSSQIQSGVENITGPFGTPQTTAGKYAESVGEFVPSAFAEPGGLLRKAVTTAAGGAGSETAGELTEGTGLEPYARFIGGIIGGAGAGATAAETKSLRLASQLPSSDRIKDSAKSAYKAVANARLKVAPQAVDTFVADTTKDLDDKLIVQQSAPRTYRALEKLQKAGGDIGQIMGTRQALGDVKPNEGTEYAAARIAIDKIDNFIDTLNPQSVVQGDPKFTHAMLDHARSSWRAYKKLDEIENVGELALHRSQATGTGANYVNAVRQEVKKILNSDTRSRGYSKEAKSQMEKIVLGTWLTNASRYGGKFAPRGPVSAIPTALTYAAKGKLAAATVGISATLSHYLGEYLTHRQLNKLMDLIRSESPIGKPIAAQIAAQQPNMAAVLPAATLRSFTANQPLNSSPNQSLGDLAGEPSPSGETLSPSAIGAKKAKDGNWYVYRPHSNGNYMKVTPVAQ